MAAGNRVDEDVGCDWPEPKKNAGCETVVVVAFIRSGRAANEFVRSPPPKTLPLFAGGTAAKLDDVLVTD